MVLLRKYGLKFSIPMSSYTYMYYLVGIFSNPERVRLKEVQFYKPNAQWASQIPDIHQCPFPGPKVREPFLGAI